MAASIRPGSSSTGAVAAHAEGRGLARRNRDAVRRHAAVLGERLHARVVASAAGAADGDDGVVRRVHKRAGKIAGAAPHGAAAGVQRAGQQIAHRIKHNVGIGARLHQPDTRLAHQHLFASRHGEHREIEVVEPPSGAGDEIAGMKIGAAWQNAVAAGGRRNDLEAAAAADDGVEWHDGIGVRRQRLADIDANRGDGQRHRRIGARRRRYPRHERRSRRAAPAVRPAGRQRPRHPRPARGRAPWTDRQRAAPRVRPS